MLNLLILEDVVQCVYYVSFYAGSWFRLSNTEFVLSYWLSNSNKLVAI